MSLVSRCARAAHLDTTRPLLADCGAVEHATKNLAFRHDLDFARLAYAARLAPHDVEARRYRRVVITSDLKGVRFHGATVPSYDLVMDVRRLVPSSLGGTPHHDALGHHGLVTHCPASGEFLIEACPRCAAKLTWSTALIELCSRCGCDLRDQPASRVSEDVRAETALMIDLVNPDPERHAAAAAALPPMLTHLDRGEAFELGWRMGCALTGRPSGDRDRAKLLPRDERISVLRAGSEALARWPASIVDALKGRPSRDGRDLTGVALAVRSLARTQSPWPAVREAIVAAAPKLIRCPATAVRAMTPDSVRGTEVQKAVGVSRSIYRRLRHSDEFKPIIETGEKHKLQVYAASAISDVKSRIGDRTSFTTAGWILGTSLHGIEQLCCLRELDLLKDGLAREVLHEPHVLASSLDHLRARLKNAASTNLPDRSAMSDDQDGRRVEIDGPWITIRRAMLVVGGRQKPWGAVFAALADGRIAFAIDDGRTDLILNGISVPISEIQRLSELAFDPGHYPAFDFGCTITRDDAEEMLNLNPRQFQEALDDDEIKCVGIREYDRAQVETLAARYISGGEILMRWCGGGRRKPDAFRGPKRLRRASRLGWLRAEVEERMAEQAEFFRAG